LRWHYQYNHKDKTFATEIFRKNLSDPDQEKKYIKKVEEVFDSNNNVPPITTTTTSLTGHKRTGGPEETNDNSSNLDANPISNFPLNNPAIQSDYFSESFPLMEEIDDLDIPELLKEIDSWQSKK
jgi:hypothetical protein